MNPRCRRFELSNQRIVAITTNHLIMDVIYVNFVLTELSMPTRHTRETSPAKK